MADYGPTRAHIDSYSKAAAVLPSLQQIYGQSQQAIVVISLYQSGSDADFNAAMNAIFTPAERQELQQMLTQLNNLVNNWSANHAVLLATEIG